MLGSLILRMVWRPTISGTSWAQSVHRQRQRKLSRDDNPE